MLTWLAKGVRAGRARVRAHAAQVPGLARWAASADRLVRIGAGPAQGLFIKPGPSDPGYGAGHNERAVQDAFTELLRHDQVVYDIGANMGFLSLLAARLVGAGGAVFAFEPVPANAQRLRDSARANGFGNVKVVEAALSDTPGQAVLALAEHAGGAMLTRFGRPSDATDALTVTTTTLDALVYEYGWQAPDFVKLDVEGAEAAVLAGAERLREAKRCTWLVEVDAATDEDAKAKVRALEAAFFAVGYTTYPLEDSYPHSGWFVRHFVARPS